MYDFSEESFSEEKIIKLNTVNTAVGDSATLN